jgi:putative membrane protein
MRIARFTSIAGALLLAAGFASADTPADLLARAMQVSMTQVELGKLAQKNADSTGVNALGARLAHDHARIGKMLTMVAQKKGVALPKALDASHRAIVDALSGKSGAAFDAAYTEQMVSDHDKAVALFTTAAQSGDADLQQVARVALPALREDQRLAASFGKLSYNVQPVAHR